MNTLNISGHHSKVFNAFDGLAIKFSILMFNHTMAAGDLYIVIYGPEGLAETKTTKRKIEYILSYIQNCGPMDELTEETVMELQTMIKVYTGIKHKPPMVVKELKKLNNFIDEIYESYKAIMNNSFELSGLTSLKHFVGNTLEIIFVDTKNPEMVPEKSENSLMSDVLLNNFEPEINIGAYLLTADFTLYLKEKKIEIGNLASANNKNAGVLKAEMILRIPHPTLFSVNELEMIREYLQKVNQPLNDKMESWGNELATINFEEKNNKTITSYYLQEVQPELAIVQSALDSHPRVKLVSNNNLEEMEVKLNLIICDVDLYWSYLLSIETLNQETITLVKENSHGIERAKKTCVIIESALYIKGVLVDVPPSNALKVNI